MKLDGEIVSMYQEEPDFIRTKKYFIQAQEIADPNKDGDYFSEPLSVDPELYFSIGDPISIYLHPDDKNKKLYKRYYVDASMLMKHNNKFIL